MGFFKKKQEELNSNILDTIDTSDIQAKEEKVANERAAELAKKIEKDMLEEDRWIWVEGYKGINPDMTANYGDEVFEIGASFRLTEEISICKYGYHFCLNLEDLLSYRGVCTRFFKVQALVKKKDYEKYGQTIYRKYSDEFFNNIYEEKINKLVAKAIILTEEIPFETLIKESPQWKKTYEKIFIENNADYNKLISTFKKDRNFSSKNWFLSIFNEKYKPLLETVFSSTLTQIFADEIISKCMSEINSATRRPYKVFDSDKFKKITTYIKGLLETEGLSKDMIVYLIIHKLDTM